MEKYEFPDEGVTLFIFYLRCHLDQSPQMDTSCGRQYLFCGNQ